MEYEIYRADDELCHHGIRGMKWGIRRYQNKDGSLTPRGKKRYDAELKKVREQEKVLKNRQATRAKIEKLEARKQAAAAEKDALDAADGKKKRKLFGRKEKAEKEVKKSIKDMTDVELYEAINRARMEDTYRQLRPEKVNKPNPFGQMLNDVVKPAATNAGRQFLENALKKAGEKMLEDKVDPNSLQALTLMRDKLKIKNEIEKLKNNEPESTRSWKDRMDELNYTKAKEKYDADKAREVEKAAAESHRANEARSRAEYEKTGSSYRYNYNVGREHTQSSDTWSKGVAGLLDSPKVDTGRKYIDSGPKYEVLDTDGTTVIRYR